MDAAHKQWLGVAITAVTILTMSSCGPAEATPTTTPGPTTTVQATTEPSTTTVATTPAPAIAPPTTPAPTTAPPTSTTATPEELLGQRALQRNIDLTICFSAPSDCDLESIISEYYVPGAISADGIRRRFERLNANNAKWTAIENVDDMLINASISPDGAHATTTVCSINRAIEVNQGTGAVIDDTVGYFRIDIDWIQNESGVWMAAGHEASDAGVEDPTCGFDG